MTDHLLAFLAGAFLGGLITVGVLMWLLPRSKL